MSTPRSPLHFPAGSLAVRGDPVRLAPERARWQWTGLDVLRLAPGERRAVEMTGRELLVVPLAGGRIITRTILPILCQPDVTMESGTSSGLGDVQFTAFYSPPSEGVTWGVGPILSMPTGGETRGTQKWSAGPSAVALSMPGPWVLGVLVNNVWSFAGEESRADVSQMLLQYFVNYNFGATGWYLSSAPIITANWNLDGDDRWIVPFGLAAGKLVRVGSRGLPLNFQAGAFYNVVRPDSGPNWSTRVQASVLLPASMLKGGT